MYIPYFEFFLYIVIYIIIYDYITYGTQMSKK